MTENNRRATSLRKQLNPKNCGSKEKLSAKMKELQEEVGWTNGNNGSVVVSQESRCPTWRMDEKRKRGWPIMKWEDCNVKFRRIGRRVQMRAKYQKEWRLLMETTVLE